MSNRPLPQRTRSSRAAADGSRLRLLEGFATAVAETGYASVTIADIVRAARVSKRTFYEHFKDKEACFLACYELASQQTMVAVAAAVDSHAPWESQIQSAAHAYVHTLESNAALTRTFMLEIYAAGPRALELRRDVHRRFAEFLRELVNANRPRYGKFRTLSPAMSVALVGGINELVLVALESSPTVKLGEAGRTAAELVRAVLTAPEP